MSVKKEVKNWNNALYWTTEAWNIAATQFFMSQFELMALNRWKWVHLPPLVDVRYLEWNLLYKGVATISYPLGYKPMNAFAMQCVYSQPNANNNYKTWVSLGENGVSWDTTKENGVIVWDSWNRQSVVPQLQFIASECANIVRTKQTIRQHMRQPVVFQAPREMQQQVKNLISQTANGNPYVIGYNAFDDIQTTVLNTSTNQEAQELAGLQQDLKDVFNLGLTYLGITVGERKMERQSVPEIQQANNPTSLMALNGLSMRRRACKELNALTGGNAKVYWNSDIETDNYNVVNNLSTLLSMPNDDLLKKDNDNAILDSEGSVQ